MIAIMNRTEPATLPPPRVLFSIDYEPWFALTRHHDHILPALRRELDNGSSEALLDPILEMLGAAKISFYMVGEVVEWYPGIPEKIINAGHELGFHCHVHRPLVTIDDIANDLRTSAGWRKEYSVRGYRAPMVRTIQAAYPLLAEAGFTYSSSIYAPSGNLIKKSGIWELPVSTARFSGSNKRPIEAPRHFSWNLLLKGELPYGSSFMIGLLPKNILHIIEKELRAGLSPVIILHPYELVRPPNWPRKIYRDLVAQPLLWPFTFEKAAFLKQLVREFPLSSLGTYIDEVNQLHRNGNA